MKVLLVLAVGLSLGSCQRGCESVVNAPVGAPAKQNVTVILASKEIKNVRIDGSTAFLLRPDTNSYPMTLSSGSHELKFNMAVTGKRQRVGTSVNSIEIDPQEITIRFKVGSGDGTMTLLDKAPIVKFSGSVYVALR